VYSLVARDQITLDEVGNKSGLDRLITDLLRKLPSENIRKSYQHDQFTFHVLSEGIFVFLCVSDSDTSLSVCFSFLDTIKKAYGSEPQKLKLIMQNEMDKFNDPSSDRIRNVKKKVESSPYACKCR